jgi:NAD(P)-dependent dehydrogenase (short-subunit alcohol dehydrogenase family)
MTQSMQGKTVLVSGATGGIGYVAARDLAGMGAQTVIVSRNADKCAAVADRIKKETGNERVAFIAADLSTKAGVQHAAAEFKAGFSRLDVLLNNAGALFFSRQVSADGIEMTFALNHLNYFYLTMLLLDVLKANGQARVINVSSGAHVGASIHFDDIQLKHGYTAMRAYGQSKLANLLFTYELARKLEGTKVTSNALHPGFVNTGFAKNNGGLVKWGMQLISPMQKNVDEGASTSIYLAASPDVESVSGKYFVDSRMTASDPASYDKAAAERLWNLSLEMVGM